MTDRMNLAGSSPFEPAIGFSRAVKIGNIIHVFGTGPAGADDGTAEEQARRVFEIIGEALGRAGADFQHVVRTRIYLRHAVDWEAVGHVHGEVFGSIQPAATMVGGIDLLDPRWLVEIEAEATLQT